MSAAELKRVKPKYPENINGTHCMGDHWTVCCPNRHLQFDRYQQTKEVVQVYYKGGIYRVFVCTAKCSKDLKTIAKSNPNQFKKLFIKGVKPNGDLILKHRDTGVIAQIAQKIDTYDDKSGKSGKSGKTGKSNKTKKQKGGYCRWFTTHRRHKHKRGCGHTMKHKKH
jgi:hypothetical protein